MKLLFLEERLWRALDFDFPSGRQWLETIFRREIHSLGLGFDDLVLHAGMIGLFREKPTKTGEGLVTTGCCHRRDPKFAAAQAELGG